MKYEIINLDKDFPTVKMYYRMYKIDQLVLIHTGEFAEAALQNRACKTQQMCYIMILFCNCS
jgi:hypothetical protein